MFGQAATVLAEENGRAFSVEPEGLACCLMNSVADRLRDRTQAHGLVLLTVAEVCWKVPRRRAVVVAVSGIRSHDDRKGLH